MIAELRVRTGDVLEFSYVNHRGEGHRYEIVVESLEYGPYDETGYSKLVECCWVLSGYVLTRDDQARATGTAKSADRRTFILTKVKSPKRRH